MLLVIGRQPNTSYVKTYLTNKILVSKDLEVDHLKRWYNHIRSDTGIPLLTA